MSKDDDKVGYGKPPKHAQWKKGQSGNPKGRPKIDKAKKATLGDFMNEPVPITTPDGKKEISTREAFLKVLRNIALKDQNIKAVKELIKLDTLYFPEFYTESDLDNPHKKILQLKAELEQEKQRTTGGVLVVPAEKTPEEWVKATKELRDKMLDPDGNLKPENKL